MRNRYAGKCAECGKRVEAGAGEAYRSGGGWRVCHDRCESGAPRASKPKYWRYSYEQKPLNGWCAYGWNEYPRGSVLAGQPRKCFLESFESLEALLAKYPDANGGGRWADPEVSLSHLPGEDDPEPGGMYPDDLVRAI